LYIKKGQKMYITIKQVLKYVKKKGFTNPTNREILRTVPPGLQDQARKGRVWIGRCGVYGSKMAYSVEDVKHFIKLSKKKSI
tara:strand:- start:337 stop:582 length:246 start_codon:yes stop_codon:yes gene_type:complete